MIKRPALHRMLDRKYFQTRASILSIPDSELNHDNRAHT
jgi:hypothetical protein